MLRHFVCQFDSSPLSWLPLSLRRCSHRRWDCQRHCHRVSFLKISCYSRQQSAFSSVIVNSIEIRGIVDRRKAISVKLKKRAHGELNRHSHCSQVHFTEQLEKCKKIGTGNAPKIKLTFRTLHSLAPNISCELFIVNIISWLSNARAPLYNKKVVPVFFFLLSPVLFASASYKFIDEQ